MKTMTKSIYGWLLAAILMELAGVTGWKASFFRLFVSVTILIFEEYIEDS